MFWTQYLENTSSIRERSLPYLKEISTQLKEVQELINETSNYMCEVERIKEEDENKEFLNRQTDEPFK